MVNDMNENETKNNVVMLNVELPNVMKKQFTTSGGKTWNGASFTVNVTYAVTKNMVDDIIAKTLKSAVIETQRAFRDNCNVADMNEFAKTGYNVPLNMAGTRPLSRTQQINEYKLRTATLSQREKIDVMFADGLIDDVMRDALYKKHDIKIDNK